MSRTDAHMPHWVTAVWYEPCHRTCRNAMHSLRPKHGVVEHECDLPATPVRRRPGISAWRHGRQTTCTWEPDWTGVSPWPRPPRWFVEHVWHNPERRRLRDELTAAIAEYRATGDVDTDPEPRQGRCSAHWLW